MSDASASRDCVSIADRLPELALGILGGAERAEVLDHLDRCAACRESSADWAATVDALPTVIDEAEPPAGFEARTLERLRADQAKVPRRSLMYRVLSVAAIVALVMIVTITAVRIIDSRSSTPSESTEMTSAQMVGHSGRRAGDVFMTLGAERYVFLDVNYGVGTGRYRVEALDAANRVTPLGHVAITGGHGAWAGELETGADGSAATPAMVRLVDEDGDVLCSARFGPTAS